MSDGFFGIGAAQKSSFVRDMSRLKQKKEAIVWAMKKSDISDKLNAAFAKKDPTADRMKW